MRRIRLALCAALALSAFGYSGSSAWAGACAVQLAVHNHASIWLNGKRLAQCVSGASGCKCVSCYNFDGSVYAACYPLVAPIPR
jgi:hypothetical protein